MKRKKQEKMIKEQTKKWLNPRRYYINGFLNHESLRYCPECGGEIEYSSEDEDEAYCKTCGLVTSASIRYVAGIRIDLPYGIRL
jgi:NADH pyrophosphatase NudC (nudix superfamily)